MLAESLCGRTSGRQLGGDETSYSFAPLQLRARRKVIVTDTSSCNVKPELILEDRDVVGRSEALARNLSSMKTIKKEHFMKTVKNKHPMKIVMQLTETLKSIPEAEREQEMYRWVKEAAATLSAKEFDELRSELEPIEVRVKVLSKRMQARGAQPGQTTAEVLTKEDFLDAEMAEQWGRHQQISDSKN